MNDKQILLDLFQRRNVPTNERELFSGETTVQVPDGVRVIEYIFDAAGALVRYGSWA